MGELALEEGLQFGLSEEAFEKWWRSAIYAEDADEYVNLHRGRKPEARFVCVLSQLIGPGRHRVSSDLIVRAYMIANEIPETAEIDGEVRLLSRSAKIRKDAGVAYDDDATQMLLDRVRYRSKRYAEERIVARTFGRIEQWYDRADAITSNSEKSQDRKLEIEGKAVESSIKLLSVQSRERTAENAERNRRSVAEAMSRNKEQPDYGASPLDSTQLRVSLEMAKEHLGPEEFYSVLESVMPKAITDNAAKG